MKKILTIVIVLFALHSQAQIKNATLQASGLTCAMCSKAVYKALSEVAFVEKVNADIENSSYDITFKSGSKVDFDALSKAVVNAGFSVAKLKVTTTFNDVKVQNDAHVTLSNQSFHFLNVTPQTLSGTKTVTLVDKNFVSAKDYKKYSKLTSLQCYESGTMNGQRMYHVTM
ncbi:MAG: heavy-metal-associated domain-containing protein [Sediminibacterium sp.]